MAKQTIEDSLWGDRFNRWDKYYRSWEGRFMCRQLEEYYEGKQWKEASGLGFTPYVTNKIYETVEIKIAQFIPTFPKFNVSSKPMNEEFDLETSMRSAQLKEDTLNTLVADERNHFPEEMEAAYKDSFFRFGMMEVGYAADWLINPNLAKPLLKKDTTRFVNDDDRHRKVGEKQEVPMNERVYFKHVPARQFRIGGLDHKYLEQCSYLGYYDYIYEDDLMSMKIMNRDKVGKAITSDDRTIDTLEGDESSESVSSDAIIKIWHVWDMRAKKNMVIVDSPAVTVFEKSFERLPLFDFRPSGRTVKAGFYPVPPVYNWLSSQNEINEAKEQLRRHRQRFTRKYQIQQGKILAEEIEKFETGPDGSLIIVQSEGAIKPIENANLGAATDESIASATDDFNRISGTSDQARGVSDRTTATQATIIDQRSSVREKKDRDRILRWSGRIGREALKVAQENFSQGFWAHLTSPEGEQLFGSIQQLENAVRWVSQADLNDNYDFRVNIEATSLSAISQEEEKKKYIEFLSILTQFPMIAFSPLMVRETAYRVGYRNERVIAELQKMALLMEQGRMLQLQQQAGMLATPPPQNGNAPQQIVAQQTPPGAEQIRQQMGKQLTQ